MTNFELIKVYQGPMKMLIEHHIRLEDARFVALYEDYVCMKEAGEKVTYAVAKLAERYHVGQRKVYQLISLMEKDCTAGAVTIPPHP